MKHFSCLPQNLSAGIFRPRLAGVFRYAQTQHLVVFMAGGWIDAVVHSHLGWVLVDVVASPVELQRGWSVVFAGGWAGCQRCKTWQLLHIAWWLSQRFGVTVSRSYFFLSWFFSRDAYRTRFGAHPGVIQSFTSNWLKQWSVSPDCGIHWYPQIVTMTIKCNVVKSYRVWGSILNYWPYRLNRFWKQQCFIFFAMYNMTIY